ncbi:TetR/AcrR family transcriptional regulator [Pseudomonas typographi]|uniref:TetR/AcrR family transcriptional regulator n=1 Tax=Pseudomonas typographi TaxID=2715964 RepID=A0ABR7Z4E7_9PSED|nr:TetR/AcrR family transcriptional regulator [Pseudomonas typographi]MBD1552752.1 TetR/AcrR family transcriptional regulator [Pseudomonas typographi]MBD1588233.1 TetR/AcrR family transcriptional regulator [Pseudomonas typographi]MBD1600204.1 TetR/AcrR family transcriptional regulator [Pseudomonas typographi]
MKQPSAQESIELPSSGQRGPAEHDRRLQILRVANEHFRLYGYRKATVADLSKAIGITTAYIYRFFESKQAIGEAICALVLGELDNELRRLADQEATATRKFRAFTRHALMLSHALFMNQSKLFDLVRVAEEESWCTAAGHQAALSEIIRSILEQGRRAGEFERKTPLDEVVLAIEEALIPYTRPSAMERRLLPDLEAGMMATTSMILRSLAP